MQRQGSSITEGEFVPKMKKLSIPKATDSELDQDTWSCVSGQERHAAHKCIIYRNH